MLRQGDGKQTNNIKKNELKTQFLPLFYLFVCVYVFILFLFNEVWVCKTIPHPKKKIKQKNCHNHIVTKKKQEKKRDEERKTYFNIAQAHILTQNLSHQILKYKSKKSSEQTDLTQKLKVQQNTTTKKKDQILFLFCSFFCAQNEAHKRTNPARDKSELRLLAFLFEPILYILGYFFQFNLTAFLDPSKHVRLISHYKRQYMNWCSCYSGASHLIITCACVFHNSNDYKKKNSVYCFNNGNKQKHTINWRFFIANDILEFSSNETFNQTVCFLENWSLIQQNDSNTGAQEVMYPVCLFFFKQMNTCT
ncbi:hypothetical protein RFI_20826 [Reticulomyxa filosa]|uniref:Uncharacterized protein n=1 Tax=Reticulomyxa filosa TaxID=46433 RepID=X6MRT2_RETFI|nr:hypothetical protein RFI_20826 [Reticulomyxa filosa]|eukprot:ETO16519.1 hypothetical protein RFI_20826 [Reticulomyxa filosa]